MNINSSISYQLWNVIRIAYESGNYCHAINDAIHFLTEIIREKSGFDDDGQLLISKSFSGENPVIKINRLQTQTEKDIQKGTEFLLRGMYQAIKNPRSHEQINDDQKTANAIILFIDYLISNIEKAKPPFELNNFIRRVLDKHFVRDQEYIEELVNSIPAKHQYEVLLELIRIRAGGEIDNIVLVCREIISKLSEDNLKEFLIVVSDGLKVVDDYSSIRLTLEMLEPLHWTSIEKTARLRLEKILMESIVSGRSDSCDSVIDDNGAIGTFSGKFISQFSNLSELRKIFLKKLNSGYDEQFYVFCFFLDD